MYKIICDFVMKVISFIKDIIDEKRVTKNAYKLLTKRKDGTLGPLFINKKLRIPTGVWLESEDHPTKGYTHRPGWHTTTIPEAPHLSIKENRVWYKVKIKNYYKVSRPKQQGTVWLVAQKMKLIKPIKGVLND